MLRTFVFFAFGARSRAGGLIMDRHFNYQSPGFKVIEIDLTSLILNGSDTVIENPGIGGPGEIEIE